MLRKVDIDYVKRVLVPHAAPMLSLYADTNPGNPENAGRAWLRRIKDALKEIPLPRDLPKQIIEKLTDVRIEGRSCALFAADDLLEIYKIQLDLPLVDLRHGRVDVRWGDPYTFPFLYLVDEAKRQGVVYSDQSRWRFFEVYLGEIEEIANAFLDLSGEKPPPPPRPAQHFVQGVVLRGGASGDRYARHIEAWEVRFFKRAAHSLEHLVEAWHIDQLLLMGPTEDTHFFEQYLSRKLRDRVAGHVPSIPKQTASAGEVLNRVLPEIEKSREAEELALLDEIRDRGRWTVPTVLNNLVMDRLYIVAAPWHLDVPVWQCKNGLVFHDREQVDAYCPGEDPKQVNLRDVIGDVAETFGARLEFMQGQAEARLLRDFGGLAGLPRW